MNRGFSILLIFLFFFINSKKCHAQNEIDSITRLLQFEYLEDDTNRVYSLIGLSYYLCFNNPDSAIIVAYEAVKIAEKTNNLIGASKAYTNIAYSQLRLGELDKSIENYLKALKGFEKIGDIDEILNIKDGIGEIYEKLGDIEKSTYYYMDAYQQSIKENNTFFQVVGLLRLSQLANQDFPDSAITMLNEGLVILDKGDDFRKDLMKQNIYQLVGETYKNKKDYKRALENFQKSFKYVEKDNIQYVATLLGYMSDLYIKTEEYEKAIEYGDSVILYATQMKDKILLQSGYSNLSVAHRCLGNFEKSLEYYQAFITYRDSTTNHVIKKELNDLEAAYQGEKKEQAIKLKNAQISNQKIQLKAEADKGKFQRYIIVLVVVLLILMIIGFIVKQRVNQKIEKQHSELQYKTIQVTDSIDYAKRIQQGMFPSRNEVLSLFPEICIYHNPKDIVSGDFYWVYEKGNKRYFAVVDCTGHGVPGAFMTIIGLGILTRIMETGIVSKPNEIIEELNKRLRKLLHEGKASKDGMDIGLVCIEGNNVEFSGTHISCCLSSNKAIKKLKGERGFIGMTEDLKLKNQIANIEGVDMIYMFTDGYPDQKGGIQGKKFYSLKLEQLLERVSEENVNVQYDVLKRTFIEWKGPLKQIDDVLVVGIKV